MASWVLVIDDDVPFAALLTEKLEAAGCFVTSANDALAGFIQAETLSPVLIILDLMMPLYGSGVDVLKKLRLNKSLTDVPVIIMTGLPPKKAESLIPAGDPFVRIMYKPPDWKLLMQTIQDMIRAHLAVKKHEGGR